MDCSNCGKQDSKDAPLCRSPRWALSYQPANPGKRNHTFVEEKIMKKYTVFTAILVTTFLQVSLMAYVEVVPTVEIISTDPPCPAILEPGQRLYVKVRYDVGDIESFQLWIRPKGSTRGCKSHPCGPLTKQIGEYEGYFFFDDRAAVINEIRVAIKDRKSKTKGYVFEKTYPLKAEWKEPEGEGPQGYSAGNASIEIISTDPPCPAILEPGQKLNMKVRYNSDGAKSVRLYTYASSGAKTSPSPALTEGKGVFDSFVYYDDRAANLSTIHFKLYNPATNRYLVDCYCPVDARWKAPSGELAKRSQVPKRIAPSYEDDSKTPSDPASRNPTYLPQATLIALLCCLSLGIVAVVYAATAKAKLESGDYEDAVETANKAKKWFIVSLVLGLVAIVLYIFAHMAE